MICASDDPEHAVLCDRTSSCTVNFLWVRVRDAITGALEGMTLAELVPLRLAPIALEADRGATKTQPQALQGAVSQS